MFQDNRKFLPYLLVFFSLQLVFITGAWAQEFVPVKYWVSFTDKQGTPYSITQPQAFLSPRAIQRRIAQNISVNESDLPVNPAYIDEILEDPDVQVFYSSRWLNGVLVEAQEVASVQRIMELPFVEQVTYVKPLVNASGKTSDSGLYKASNSSQVRNTAIQGIDNGQLLQDESALHSVTMWEVMYSTLDYGMGRRQVEQVNGQVLHQAGYLGHGKVIAVLDAGFSAVDQLQGVAHLWQNNQILATRDFVDQEADFFNTHYHGTVVLSVMAVDLPGQVLGTARGAGYLLLRTEDHRSEFVIEEYNWLAGAEFADSTGADIINSSLGYATYDDPLQDYSYQDLDGITTVAARAANMAFEKGILVVNSAGNDGQSPWRYIATPADSFGALSIGAVDSAGVRVPFSSVGPTADGRIKPDIMAMGTRVVVENVGGSLVLANGTSFASPIIAGMAACLWEKHPDISASRIRRAIVESSGRFFAPDTLNGHGIPDFAKADRLILNDFRHEASPLVIFPNPFNPNSVLTFYSESDQVARLDIFDSTGRLIYAYENISAASGVNSFYPFRNLGLTAQGMYLIRLSYSNQSSAQVFKAIKAW